ARVSGMATGEGISPGGDAKRASVSRHVEAVRQESHRAGQPASRDLDNHHRCRQSDDISRAFLVPIVRLAQEIVTVAVGGGCFVVHLASGFRGERPRYSKSWVQSTTASTRFACP